MNIGKKINNGIKHTNRAPRYKIGDIVNKKFVIIKVYRDLQIRYLCQSKYYKEMFFEEDIRIEL